MMRLIFAMICLCGMTACGTSTLPERLGTMKNPMPVLENPERNKLETRYPLMVANFDTLKKAADGKNGLRFYDPLNKSPVPMKDYISAGFALSDMYCSEFFRDADESQRRRKYGRALTNDVGTAVSTVLGLANAGENIVTGVAAGVGLADSAWRNYDEAFVVSPDLSNVRTLVLTSQDLFRQRTLEKLPTDYGTAQSVILRYAEECSTLGMKALLNKSTNAQETELKEKIGQEDESTDEKADSASKAIPSQ